MSMIIGIFDDEASLDEAVNALQELGVDDGALSVLGGPGREDVAVPGPGPAVLPGTGPDSRNSGVAVNPDRPPASALAAVSSELGDRVENEEQLRHYASVLAHDGRILSLRVAKEHVEDVVKALHTSGASHVDNSVH